MKISKYFNLKELTYSATAAKRHIPNEPPAVVKENLIWLARNVLDLIREYENAPLYVLSGFRCRELNNIIPGASKNSQHIYGQAADVTFGDRFANQRVFDLLAGESCKIDFDQLIEYDDYSFLHVSFRRDGKNRNEVLHKVRMK